VLCYDLYTVVADGCLLIVEQALRDRFLDIYEGREIPFRSKSESCPLRATRYEVVLDHLRECKVTQIEIRDGTGQLSFRSGLLANLMSWARAESLLVGQRARRYERLLQNHRNIVAHPSNYQLTSPVQSVRAIHDLAEFVNQLWGQRTPGSTRYPAPVPREIRAVGWDHGRTSLVGPISVDELGRESGDANLTWLLLRSARDLFSAGSLHLRYATTLGAVDYLWGQGL
jgi:hypothetical protein